MPLLTSIPMAPAAAGLASVLPVSRRVMSSLNVLAFGATLVLGIALLRPGAGARRGYRMG